MASCADGLAISSPALIRSSTLDSLGRARRPVTESRPFFTRRAIDLTARADQPVGAAASIVDELARHSTQRLVLLRVKLPPKLPLKNEVNALVEPTLRVAMRSFRKRCADLTSGPACNNICS